MMKRCITLMASAVLVFLMAFSSYAKKGTFTGTWCVSDEGLVISFAGGDTLAVSSLRDESIQGTGTYEIGDTLLTAKVSSEDLIIEMSYRYKWQDETTVKARIVLFTINGEEMNHPVQWLSMVQCDPENGIIPEDEED